MDPAVKVASLASQMRTLFCSLLFCVAFLSAVAAEDVGKKTEHPAEKCESETAPAIVEEPTPKLKEGVFSKEELYNHRATEDKSQALWLAIMGEIFDVSKGRESYYGPTGGYKFFTGIDGTRAFVTGEFNETGLRPDINGLTPEQVKSIKEWKDFYHKDYKYVGKLHGLWYDENGLATAYHHKALKKLVVADSNAKLEEEDRKAFPCCNSRWAAGKPGEMWCTTESCGIKRDWVGVPRKRTKPDGSSGCVCVDLRNPLIRDHEKFAVYPHCAPESHICYTEPTEPNTKWPEQNKK